MELNYCVQCGKRLTMKSVGDEGEQKYCADCKKYFFDNPVGCVLVAIINEHKQVLLLRQEYISKSKWTLCSGYVKKGDTLEETVIREVYEETGQRVINCKYVRSYYFEPKNIIMSGFIAYVKEDVFGVSGEVDDLKWFELNRAKTLVERENNYSGVHLDNIVNLI